MIHAERTTFAVTEDHLKLARRMYVGWLDVEYGAPEINPKRPYGNSDVPSDIADILGRELSDDDAYAIHREMETVLQITLVTGQFKTGRYEVDAYSVAWREVEDA
jgi:hypothetical protein